MQGRHRGRLCAQHREPHGRSHSRGWWWVGTLNEIFNAGWTGHCAECSRRTSVASNGTGTLVCWRCGLPATDVRNEPADLAAIWTDGPDSEAARAARGEGTRRVFDFDGTEVRLSYDTIGRSWMWHAGGRAGGARTVSEALFYCGMWLGRREARQLVVDALEEFS